MRATGAGAQVVLAIAVPAVVVGCGGAYGSRVAGVPVAVAVAFAVGCVVASARDPRRAGVNTISVILAASVASGVRVGGLIPVSDLIPTAVLVLTLIPGVCGGSPTRARELW